MDNFRYQLNINNILSRTLHRRPDTEIVYRDKRFSWMEFYERVRRLSSSLSQLGVKKGTKVREDFLPLLAKLGQNLRTVSTIITMSDSGMAPSFPGNNVKFYDDLITSGDPQYVFVEPDENDVATIFYTSGTTGMPKGVWFSHRQIVLHSLASLVGFGMAPAKYSLEATDVIMPVVPFFHVHCWGLPYNAALLGSKFVLVGKYDP